MFIFLLTNLCYFKHFLYFWKVILFKYLKEQIQVLAIHISIIVNSLLQNVELSDIGRRTSEGEALTSNWLLCPALPRVLLICNVWSFIWNSCSRIHLLCDSNVTKPRLVCCPLRGRSETELLLLPSRPAHSQQFSEILGIYIYSNRKMNFV